MLLGWGVWVGRLKYTTQGEYRETHLFSDPKFFVERTDFTKVTDVNKDVD